MPGGSAAPFVAALGAAAPSRHGHRRPRLVGATILALTLLYWGREIRDFDHAARGNPRNLPAVVPPASARRPCLGCRSGRSSALRHGGPHAGLVFGGWVLAAGIVILVATLVGWLVDARAEYAKTEEADRTGHLESIPAPRWPRACSRAPQ
jgi:hypothetical protein